MIKNLMQILKPRLHFSNNKAKIQLDKTSPLLFQWLIKHPCPYTIKLDTTKQKMGIKINFLNDFK
jgi:hypothetical protein